tara:strand:+ start:2224 stop:3186 length:963 start_codon:yes stop_codon:yes gene_type:complete
MDKSIISRNLLLAKEFFLQAKENSQKIDSVSRMMAIHNFHIAVEITLKTIILEYEIRAEKELNIDFESMMGEISKNIKDKKFPYRQDLRSMNVLRGLIQHQGIEPASSSLETFEVITKRFLTETYQSYFDINFNSLSRVSLISDEKIQSLLNEALKAQNEGYLLKSMAILDGTFQLVTPSLNSLLPTEGFNSSFFVTNNLGGLNMPNELKELYEPIKIAFEKTYERIRISESFTALLGSGISLSDLNRFQSKPFSLSFSINGNPIVQTSKDPKISIDECIWSYNFIVSTVLLWQKIGLKPCIYDDFSNTIEALIDFDKNY